MKLSDDQFPRFWPGTRALQEVRRRAQIERMRALARTAASRTERQSDEPPFKDRLQALQDIETRTAAEVRKAYEGIDQVLDLRQQASFRVFEEQMERRKIELVTRARQANRPKPGSSRRLRAVVVQIFPAYMP